MKYLETIDSSIYIDTSISRVIRDTNTIFNTYD